MRGFDSIYNRVFPETIVFPVPDAYEKIEALVLKFRALMGEAGIPQCTPPMHFHFIIAAHSLLEICQNADLELLEVIMRTNGRFVTEEDCKARSIITADQVRKSAPDGFVKVSCEVLLDPRTAKQYTFIVKPNNGEESQTYLREEDYCKALEHLKMESSPKTRADILNVVLANAILPNEESIDVRILREIPFLVRTCSWCNYKGIKLDKCGQCKRCYYCNAECQNAHWKDHRKVCSK